MTEGIAIYGIFLPSKKCLYIGATADPCMRECSHLNRRGGTFRKYKGAKFKILARVFSAHDAWLLEALTIGKYWKLGEARFNKTTPCNISKRFERFIAHGRLSYALCRQKSLCVKCQSKTMDHSWLCPRCKLVQNKKQRIASAKRRSRKASKARWAKKPPTGKTTASKAQLA